MQCGKEHIGTRSELPSGVSPCVPMCSWHVPMCSLPNVSQGAPGVSQRANVLPFPKQPNGLGSPHQSALKCALPALSDCPNVTALCFWSVLFTSMCSQCTRLCPNVCQWLHSVPMCSWCVSLCLVCAFSVSQRVPTCSYSVPMCPNVLLVCPNVSQRAPSVSQCVPMCS